MAKKQLRTSLALLITLVMVLTMFGNGVMAATTAVTTKAKFGQTECRTTMLNLINDFRQSGDGWYWNSDNKTKTYTGKLNKVSYDYNLEQIAMQRAVEIAASFSHTRPNGEDCFSLTYGGTRSYGECLAAGNSTANPTFIQWKEEDELYGGQGHRRIMLGGSYGAVGIAHVQVNGADFWVLEFGFSKSSAAQTTANDSEVMRTVDLDLSNSTLNVMTRYSMYVTYGSAVDLPTVNVGLKSFSNWGNGLDISNNAVITWSSDDSSIASIAGGNIKGVSAGTTTVNCTVTAYGISATKSISVTVDAKSLSDATIELDSTSYTYTGSAIKPGVTVTDGSKTLVENVDYTVSYSNNTTVPISSYYYYQPSVKITGKGNYADTVTEYFSINPYDISKCTITNAQSSYPYTGSTIVPKLTIKNGKTELTTSDYTLTASGRTPGTYDYTLTGNGNYTGTYSGTYEISKKVLTDITFNGLGSFTYNGYEINPYFYLSSGSTSISSYYYDISYSNNVNAGEGTITVTGKDFYDFTASATFTINPRPLDSNYVAFANGFSTYTYNGKPVEPEFYIAYSGTVLTEGTDYDVTFENNSAAGNASATITFKGNYTGTVIKYFTILAAPTAIPTATPVPTKAPTATSAPTTAPGVNPTATPTNTPAITPNDGGSNTETGVAGFVERLYTVAMGRESDPSGKAYWENEVKVNGKTGADLGLSFLLSPEFLGKNMSTDQFLDVLYRTFFDREGEAGGKTYWTNEMVSGRKSKVDVIYGFINSEEWANICLTYGIKSGTDVKPTITITPNQDIKNFAERLYTTCLNRPSEAAGLNYWSYELSNLRKSGSEVAKGFFFSEELVNSGISDAEFLTRLYKTVMGREPEAEGFNFWLGQMKSGAMSRSDVFDGFATSEEWIGICADYGILR